MKNSIDTPLLTLVILLFLNSCQKPSPSANIENLEGYWEISKASLPDGTEKEFSINTTIDYITLTDSTGTRQKLRPKLDGTYSVTGTVENFVLSVRNDTLLMQYHTPFDSWEEQVLSATAAELIVRNPQGIVYTYKKFSTFKQPE
jgi:hypothetical protein